MKYTYTQVYSFNLVVMTELRLGMYACFCLEYSTQLTPTTYKVFEPPALF